VSDLAELLVQDAEAWHAWLDSHHADHPGVWLVLHKKGGQATALTYAQALDEALCFGWIDGQIARRDDDSYRQRFTPRRPGSPWSARNVQYTACLTEAGRMQPAGIAAVDAANRYAIVYRLNTVKRPATRDRKLAGYVDMLARGESIHPRKPRKDRQ
jgi:uncharacterized protein YdeI (YjbR/CyaY-like superfamily)